jgi:hypothetical protein
MEESEDTPFERIVLPLDPNHQWTAAPGCRIAVLDRGAIRFELPQDWVFVPDRDSMKFYDHQPPDDNARLAASRPRLPVRTENLSLRDLISMAVRDDDRGIHRMSDVRWIRRDATESAWLELQFKEPAVNREAISRLCLARSSGIHALITLEYWLEDAERFIPVWEHVLNSLTIGEFILNPQTGSRIIRNHPQTG